MQEHAIVSREEWTEARIALLQDEKAVTRQMDALAEKRRGLPWSLVKEEYVFETAEGRSTLAEMFAGRSQLVVYHFMFGADWAQGCHRCSFWADNFDGVDVHLAHRDTTFVVTSNAPQAKLNAYRERMGWSFRWVSAGDSDFSKDFHVTFAREEHAAGTAYYNFKNESPPFEEMPGLSVFVKLADGRVAHAYSTYARGLDGLWGAYQWLDRAPHGRNESGIWWKRHDEYGRSE